MALWDLANADCIVVMGSNMAENHPVAFRFVTEAQTTRRHRGARGSALHPHLGAWPTSTRRSGPARTSHSWAGSSATFWRTTSGSASSRWPSPISRRSSRIAIATPRTMAACSPASIDKNASYAPDSWQYQGEVLPSPLAEHFVADGEFRAGCREGYGGTRRQPIQRCNIRAASIRSCATTMSAIRRRWWSV